MPFWTALWGGGTTSLRRNRLIDRDILLVHLYMRGTAQDLPTALGDGSHDTNWAAKSVLCTCAIKLREQPPHDALDLSNIVHKINSQCLVSAPFAGKDP